MQENSEKLKISVTDPFTEFEKHLNSFGNSRIFFSAPFGQGKTYFLNYFFEEKKTDFEVFKVFPVNYSVATNQDIFRYIKADILFQLMNKGILFEDSPETLIEISFLEHLALNKEQFILEFLRVASLLDKRIETFVNVSTALSNLFDSLKLNIKSEEESDMTTSTKFINDLLKEEGSIFEDNIYTQLIRTLLSKLKTFPQIKKPVLVIEDLDRMDPDHIFRILNVISAHYDNPHFPDEENKFGFDKIIIVADIKNIENIFHHKYGDKTDFNGYISKYFTSKPFEFTNQNELKDFLRNKYFNDNNEKTKSPHSKAFNLILEAMMFSNVLSLRELLRVTKVEFDSFRPPTFKNNNGYHEQRILFFKALSQLAFCFGNERMLQLTKMLKIENLFLKRREYDFYCRCIIPRFINGEFLEYNQSTYSGVVTTNGISNEYSIFELDKKDFRSPIHFSHTDFYEYLEKYALEFVGYDLVYS